MTSSGLNGVGANLLLMKLAVLTTGFPPERGGIQSGTYELVRRLKGERFVICPDYPGAAAFDARQDFTTLRVPQPLPLKLLKSTLIRMEMTLFFDLRYTPIVEPLARAGLDVIHVKHIALAGVAYRIKQKFGIPYVVYAHAQELMPPYTSPRSRKMRKVLNGAALLFVHSDYTKRVLREYVPEEKICKIPAGADLTTFFPQPPKKSLVKSLGLKGKKVLLSVARLEDYKGIDFVLRSLPSIIARVPNVHYLIVGTGEDYGRLVNLVASLGVSDHVTFIGDVEDTAPYYNLCDLFILCSRDCSKRGPDCPHPGRVEGFGVVFVEASACGKPVIGGMSGGVPDAVIDRKTGLLVNPTDVDAIATSVVKILTKPNYAKSLGNKGRRFAAQVANYDLIARQVEREIASVLKPSRGSSHELP